MTTSRNTEALRAERPLTARSVLASALLGTDPPWLPTSVLLRAGELFGLPEGTVRVALSRMAAAGEVTAVDGGYRLAGRLLARQDRQRGSRHPVEQPWTGAWRQAVVHGERRPPEARADLRAAMATLRLAELREGVWLRPDNLTDMADLADGAARVIDGQCTWFSVSPRADGRELAQRLWDLEGWAARAEELRAGMAADLPGLEAGDAAALAPCFVRSAAVLRHFQADPLLPGPLLPPAWPGAALRREYDGFDRAYRALLGAWLHPRRPRPGDRR